MLNKETNFLCLKINNNEKTSKLKLEMNCALTALLEFQMSDVDKSKLEARIKSIKLITLDPAVGKRYMPKIKIPADKIFSVDIFVASVFDNSTELSMNLARNGAPNQRINGVESINKTLYKYTSQLKS